MEPTIMLTAATAFIPIIGDVVRAFGIKLTKGAGAQPANIEERINLMEAETKNFKALAEIDKVGDNVWPWVNSIRALQRPAATVAILGAYFFVGDVSHLSGLETLAGCATFYLFGDRTVFHMRNSNKK